MNLSIYTKRNERMTTTLFLCLPSIYFYRKEVCDFGEDYRTTNVDFSTNLVVRSSVGFFYFELRLLGFGLKCIIQEWNKSW